MIESWHHLPVWISRSIWSGVTIVLAVIVGQVIKQTVCRRLSRWARQTVWKWDELVIEALQRGIPMWSLLTGLYVAIGFWPLSFHLLSASTRCISVLGWLSVTFVAANLAAKLIVLYGTQFQHAMPVTSLTQHIAKLCIVTLGVLMILHSMGLSIAPLLTALGVGGLAVALALQDTLSNLFAGFYLTMSRQVRLGDYVKLESGEEGSVEDIGWRATKIRMLANNTILVPNNTLGKAIITNYNLPDRELAVLIEVGVEYRSDLSKVERVTLEVAHEVLRTVPGGVSDAQPLVRYHTFGESSINFTAVLRAKTFADQYLVKHEFIKQLHLRYAKEGIVIPFPIRTIQMAEHHDTIRS